MSRLIPIISILLLFLLLVGVMFLLWPKYQEVTSLKLQLERREMVLEQKELNLIKLQEASQKLTEYEEELSIINSALPKESSVPALFNFVQQSSAQSGLILKEVKLEGITASKFSGIDSISFLISVSGSYSSLKDFLSVVQKTARLVEVDSISFSSQTENGLFDFNISLRTHSYKDKKSNGQEEEISQEF